MTRQELNRMGRDLRRVERRDKLTALGDVVAVFVGVPLYGVLLWVILEFIIGRG